MRMYRLFPGQMLLRKTPHLGANPSLAIYELANCAEAEAK